MEVVFNGEIIKFSKNYGTFAIKESGGVKVQIIEFQKDNNNIIIKKKNIKIKKQADRRTEFVKSER